MLLLLLALATQRPDSLGAAVRKVVRVSTAHVVLEHVNVIDGTGTAPTPNRNITIEAGRITAISAGADVPPADGTTILDLRGYSVMPGIVGMHNHLIYLSRPNLAADNTFDRPGLFQQMTFSASRLYLANGVTTMRTTGSPEPYTDLKLKRAIDSGLLPGPHPDVTGPYLDGPGGNLQMPESSWPSGPATNPSTVICTCSLSLRIAIKECLGGWSHLCVESTIPKSTWPDASKSQAVLESAVSVEWSIAHRGRGL